MRKTFLTFVSLLLITSYALSQKQSYFKRLFIDAEFYLLYEEYNEALPLFLEIYRSDKVTANLNYRIGQCYLFLPNQKHRSITYLKEAIKDVALSDYKEGYYTEERAEIKSYLYLGMAYRINYEFDKALQALQTYDSLLKQTNANDPLLEIEINALSIAEELILNEQKIKKVNLGQRINSSFSNINPAVCVGDSVMVFTSRLRFYDAIFFTRRRDGEWHGAINLSSQLQLDGNLLSASISPDGKQIFVISNDNDDLNIYISTFSNNIWSPLEKLDKPINERSYEEFASLSPDGKTLYFTSNREGGLGGYDIYTSTKNAEGEWTQPINLGPKINTPFDETAPFFTSDSILYFSSNGQATMGGFDIFYCEKFNGEWGPVKNLGYPLNTTDDDLFYCPIDKTHGYISKFDPEGYGDYDIFYIEILP